VTSIEIGISIGPSLYAMFMVFARVTAMLHALPLFSMSAVPVPVRAGLGALIALIVAPWVAADVGPEVWEVGAFAVSLVSEVFLGVAMGFSVRLMMAIIDVLGTVLAANCGLGMASQFDPVTQSQGLIISRLVQTAGFLVFLSLNLHHDVIAGLVGTFTIAPPGEGVLAFTAGALFSEIYEQMLRDTTRLSMPLVVAVLFFNMVSALVTRFAQQMNIYFSIGLSANVWAGLMAIGATIPALIATILNRTQDIGGVMRVLAGG